MEGQDETWVRPVRHKLVPSDAYSQLVGCDFTTAGGTKLQGYMTVTTADEIEISVGAIIGDGIYCVLPSMSDERAREEGLNWVIHSRKETLKVLGATATQIFPIAYTLRVCIRGEKAVRSGVVE